MDRYYEYTDRLNTPIEAFTHITYDYNFPILPHWHYFIECIYLTAGNLLVTCDENVYSLQPGDFIFFPPKTLHTIDVFPTDFEQSQAEKPSQDPAFTLKSQDFLKNPSLHGYLPNFPLSSCPLLASPQEPLPDQEHDSIHPVSIPHSAANVSEKSPSITTVAASDCKAASPLNIRYHVLKFDLGFLQATDNMKNQFSRIISLAYEEDPSNIFFANGDMTGIPLEQLFVDCIEEVRLRHFGYDTIACSKLAILITAMTRVWLMRGLNMEEILLSRQSDNHEFEHIAEYIKSHYNEPLRIHDLAERCGMSYSYFAKLFRRNYHQSCKEYIEFVRINRVTDLLLFTKLDLTYISQETGFSDCSHLIRTFRKWKGCTPRQWMREYSSELNSGI